MEHGGHVFVVGIHPSRTWMVGPFESVQWSACMHRLDLNLCSHPKEFGGNGVRTHVNSMGKKSPVPDAQRRIKPTTLHHANQQAQHTTKWAVLALIIHNDLLLSWMLLEVVRLYLNYNDTERHNVGFAQSPHHNANCLQHACSPSQGTVMCSYRQHVGSLSYETCVLHDVREQLSWNHIHF